MIEEKFRIVDAFVENESESHILDEDDKSKLDISRNSSDEASATF
jgi:hypothetical protein